MATMNPTVNLIGLTFFRSKKILKKKINQTYRVYIESKKKITCPISKYLIISFLFVNQFSQKSKMIKLFLEKGKIINL